MTRIHLDFETRSTADLPKVGVHNYANDPTTDVWMARYAIDDGPINEWRPGWELPADLAAALEDPDAALVAWNAMFEWHILEYVLAPRYGWPEVDIERLDDPAARAAMMSLPRALGQAAPAMGLPVEKDDQGRRLMLQMMKPRKPRKDEDPDALLWWDEPEKIDRLSEYCARDVEVERELDKVLVPLPKRELKLWRLTAVMNLRGVCVDLDLVEQADRVVKLAIDRCNDHLAAATDGELTSVNQTAKITDWLQKRGLSIDGLDKDTVSAWLSAESIPDDCRRVLELRQEAAKSSTAKLKAFRERTSADGRMRENLLYHGAGTGRWSGMGVQLQNLPRPELSGGEVKLAVSILKDTSLSVADRCDRLEFLFGSVPSAVASCLRACIMAPDDHVLRMADYANIEGRTNAWQAGQTDKVELFRKGAKIYERMAAAVFDMRPEDVEKDSQERFLGKTLELGAGYGMGGPKFKLTCAKQGVEITDELAQTSIDTFRKVNSRIKGNWYAMEEAAVDAMRDPANAYECRGIYFYQRVIGGVTFLCMRLPSGRNIYYPHAKLRQGETPWGAVKDEITYMGVDAVTRKWVRQKTYGGKLVENAIQAEARDMLGVAMLRCEKYGYWLVLTVHDEIVSETPADYGSQDEFEELMVKMPRWAEGCPVAVEGKTDVRFGK